MADLENNFNNKDFTIISEGNVSGSTVQFGLPQSSDYIKISIANPGDEQAMLMVSDPNSSFIREERIYFLTKEHTWHKQMHRTAFVKN